jgi:pyridoxine kinase
MNKKNMNKADRLRRVAAIHDLSGFGKCSLTVALPVLSAAGIETSALPTAILSTHTGGIDGFTYLDMTGEMRPFIRHWKSLGIHFDAIYSGFLGSFEQLEIVKEFFDTFRQKDTLILVDPVMADNGELYKIFTPDFAQGMKGVCEKADVIVPNITEAALLLGETYRPGPYPETYIEYLLRSLSDLGPKQIVLTGVYFSETELGAATYDRETGQITHTLAPRVPGYYHGTGDVYASALLAGLLNGFGLGESAGIAVRYTAGSIRRTWEAGSDVRFGVNFEQGFPDLLKELIH